MTDRRRSIRICRWDHRAKWRSPGRTGHGNDGATCWSRDISELHSEIDDRARRVTRTAGESIGAYLAWNDERVGLGWSDKDDTQHDIYFQEFDAAGAELGRASAVTTNATWSLVPAVRPWRSGFALAWTEDAPASEEIHDGTCEVAFTLVE